MKKLILGLLAIVLMASMLTYTGCIRKNLSEENGPLTTRSYDYTGFTGVDVGSALKLEVSYGASYKITVTAGENLFNRIHVVKSGDILRVYTEGWSIHWWWGHTTPKVTVTMPVLKTINLSGASDGSVSGFKSGNDFTLTSSGASHADIDMETGAFKLDISGASDIKGRLTAYSSDIKLSGASDLDLTGAGGNIKVNASGASTASLRYYTAQDADVTLTGASDGSVDVSGKLDVDLSGASSLNYWGNPSMGDIRTSGASDLRHKTN